MNFHKQNEANYSFDSANLQFSDDRHFPGAAGNNSFSAVANSTATRFYKSKPAARGAPLFQNNFVMPFTMANQKQPKISYVMNQTNTTKAGNNPPSPRAISAINTATTSQSGVQSIKNGVVVMKAGHSHKQSNEYRFKATSGKGVVGESGTVSQNRKIMI